MVENRPKMNLFSIETYMKSSLENLNWQLQNFFSSNSEYNIELLSQKIEDFNAYKNIDKLENLKNEHLTILDDENIDIKPARDLILNGEFFWETAAAGEATRLGLGSKYLINLHEFSTQRILDIIKDEIDKDNKDDPKKAEELKSKFSVDILKKRMGGTPEEMLPISLGIRHMIQMVYDVRRLAEENNLDPQEIVNKQKVLLVLNETTGNKIVDEFIKYNFFSLNPKNVFFMIQKNFHGIEFKDNKPFYDQSHDNHKRLHNHGQMAMQKTHDNEIFNINTETNQKNYLKSIEFEKILESTKVLLSYNVEDINYLTNSIDLPALALSLELKDKGHNMTMELVAQNLHRPQVGGACFYDSILKRTVMVEANQLRGLDFAKVDYLNKNFNHYMDPVVSFKALRDGNIHMHTSVKLSKCKDGNPKKYLYFATPQGDINFLVSTAYVMRKNLKPIANWKSPATTPPTVKACLEQDKQYGFKKLCEQILNTKF